MFPFQNFKKKLKIGQPKIANLIKSELYNFQVKKMNFRFHYWPEIYLGSSENLKFFVTTISFGDFCHLGYVIKKYSGRIILTSTVRPESEKIHAKISP